jgi:hypothetical protein
VLLDQHINMGDYSQNYSRSRLDLSNMHEYEPPCDLLFPCGHLSLLVITSVLVRFDPILIIEINILDLVLQQERLKTE